MRSTNGTSCTSMSRTTAFPCMIIARMMLAGQIDQTGVIAPEQLTAMPGVLDAVLAELAKRRVTVEFSERAVV